MQHKFIVILSSSMPLAIDPVSQIGRKMGNFLAGKLYAAREKAREKINKKLRQNKKKLEKNKKRQAGCIVQSYELEHEVMQKFEPLFMYEILFKLFSDVLQHEKLSTLYFAINL